MRRKNCVVFFSFSALTVVCGAGLGAALGLGQVGFSHGRVLSHRKEGSQHRLGNERSHS